MRLVNSAWDESAREPRRGAAGAAGSAVAGAGVVSIERSPSMARAVGKPQTVQCWLVGLIVCSQIGQLDAKTTTFGSGDVRRGLNYLGWGRAAVIRPRRSE